MSGAVTLTANKPHVATGAPYTVSLPTAATAGQWVGLRLAASNTDFVTVNTTGGQLIDGASTILLWAGESVTFVADGTNWVVVAAKWRPLKASMWQAAGQTVPSTTWTKITLDSAGVDNSGKMADVTNHRVVIQRTNLYTVSPGIYWAQLAANVGRAITLASKNGAPGVGTTVTQGEETLTTGDYGSVAAFPVTVSLAAGDVLELYGNQMGTGSENTQGAAGASSVLEVTEASVPF